MRTLIDLKTELHKLEEKMEANKGNGGYTVGKTYGQILELEEAVNDFRELVEWIQKSEKVNKEMLLTKVRGEVIG